MRLLSKAKRIYSLSAQTPVAYRVAPGEILVVETQDAMDGQIPALGQCVAEVDDSRANPMTGPIHVEGASPGQTLAIHILEIEVDDQGWMSRSPTGLVNPVRVNLVEFVPGAALPLRPMIGVLGLAPAEGAYTGKDATRVGGNYDIKAFCPSATVYMPVQVPGGRLVLGDVHALQADGECSGTGIEIGARITLWVDILEHGLSDWPYVYREGVLSTVGVAPGLRDACEIAVSELARILSRASGLDEARSRMFLSLMADVHIGQFVCPIQSAYASLDLGKCPWPIHL
ncbi:MAG: acetamidase/formamidase family protein [Anaerolineae bacterium]|nr:acetamidase/formamidase family protein [Anaerolineae bacterium]